MVKTKKFLEQLLLACEHVDSLTSRHKKFVKYKYETENEELKKKIEDVISGLVALKEEDSDGSLEKHLKGNPNYYKEVQSWGNFDGTGRAMCKLINAEDSLKRYCNELLKEEKPEWQIIAERNGWRPPV